MRPERAQRGPMRVMAKEIKGNAGVDQDLIRELAQLLDETGLTNRDRPRRHARARRASGLCRRRPCGSPVASRAAGGRAALGEPAVGDSDPGKHPGCVRSPMVGTAYLGPEPGAPPFVGIGSRVVQGQTILIIEAMKTMNHIPAPKAGVVTRVLVGNRQPVEFGEPLAIIE